MNDKHSPKRATHPTPALARSVAIGTHVSDASFSASKKQKPYIPEQKYDINPNGSRYSASSMKLPHHRHEEYKENIYTYDFAAPTTQTYLKFYNDCLNFKERTFDYRYQLEKHIHTALKQQRINNPTNATLATNAHDIDLHTIQRIINQFKYKSFDSTTHRPVYTVKLSIDVDDGKATNQSVKLGVNLIYGVVSKQRTKIDRLTYVYNDRVLRVRVARPDILRKAVAMKYYDRVRNNGLYIGGRHFSSCGFFKDDVDCFIALNADEQHDELTREKVMNRMGNYSNILNPFKLSKRMALSLTPTYPTIDLTAVKHMTVVADEKSFDTQYGTWHLLTDGCGVLSVDVMQRVWHELCKRIQPQQCTSNYIQRHDYPSTIQIRAACRLGGFKGMLMLDKSLNDNTIIFRNSMRKYDAPLDLRNDEQYLGVLSYSRMPKLSSVEYQAVPPMLLNDNTYNDAYVNVTDAAAFQSSLHTMPSSQQSSSPSPSQVPQTATCTDALSVFQSQRSSRFEQRKFDISKDAVPPSDGCAHESLLQSNSNSKPMNNRASSIIDLCDDDSDNDKDPDTEHKQEPTNASLHYLYHPDNDFQSARKHNTNVNNSGLSPHSSKASINSTTTSSCNANDVNIPNRQHYYSTTSSSDTSSIHASQRSEISDADLMAIELPSPAGRCDSDSGHDLSQDRELLGAGEESVSRPPLGVPLLDEEKRDTNMLSSSKGYPVGIPPHEIRQLQGEHAALTVSDLDVNFTHTQLASLSLKYQPPLFPIQLPQYGADLNRQVIVLLKRRGVPDAVFLNLFYAALDLLMECYDDINAAEKLAKSRCRSEYNGQSGSSGYGRDDNDGSERDENAGEAVEDDCTSAEPASGISSYSSKSIARLTWDMIVAGWELKEPQMRLQLSKLKESQLRTLQEQTKLPCPASAFLFALPVPSSERDALAPNQIFIQIQGTVIEGCVAVTRFPAYKAEHLMVMQAVDVPSLHHLQNVAVFSIQCEGMSPLEQMSGGDYDGDKVLVIWNGDIVRHIQAHPSESMKQFIDEDRRKAANAAAQNNETVISDADERYRHAQSLFLDQLCDMELGRINNHWLAYALMLGQPDSQWVTEREERELATLCEIAVDAPKTGINVSLPPHIRPKAWPHCCASSRPQYVSVAECRTKHVIAEIYDRCSVEQHHGDKARYRTEVQADWVLVERWNDQMKSRPELTRDLEEKAKMQLEQFYAKISSWCQSQSRSGKRTNGVGSSMKNSHGGGGVADEVDGEMEWSSIVQDAIDGFWSDWPELPVECRQNILTLLEETDKSTRQAILDKASVYYFVAWQKAFYPKSHFHSSTNKHKVNTSAVSKFGVQDGKQQEEGTDELRKMWFVWSACFEVLLYMKTRQNGKAVMCANNRQHLLFCR